MIYILTGPIRSGKTTTIKDWAEQRMDVDGLLSPDDDNGKRFFLKIKSREEIEFEVEFKSEKTINIGRFHFLKSSFEKANSFLKTFSSEPKNYYLILDELGKLELKNEGLHASTEILISKFLDSGKHYLILVVRDYLLDDIVAHYNISAYKIITKDALDNL